MQQSSRTTVLLVAIIAVIAALVMFRPASAEGDTITAAFDAEFHTRPDGYKGLTAHYNFSFPSPPLQMDPGLMYRTCANGDVDVIDAFATDGRIEAYDLKVLEDDKNFFPPYYAAPLVRKETLEAHPSIRDALNALAGTLDDDTMRTLNYQVDEKGKKPYDAARDFLVGKGLLAADAEPTDGGAGTVTVGGKHFTEQDILAEMMAILIECNTPLTVKRMQNLGGTLICFNALKAGDIDVYAEYTGTGLVNILDQTVITDPDKAYEEVKKTFEAQYNMIWLEPLGFNNTYTLTMRKEQTEKLDIETISDLAAHLRKNE